MKRKGKVLGAFFLALCLMLTMIPMASFALDGDLETPPVQLQEQEEPVADPENEELTLLKMPTQKGGQLFSTSIKIYFKENNNSILAQNIKTTPNPLEISVPDSYFDTFELRKAYDVSEYVPDYIWDDDGSLWILNDGGSGQQLNPEINRFFMNPLYYHYKGSKVGSLTIDKNITGEDYPEGSVFSFKVEGPYGYDREFTITGDNSLTVNHLPYGDYTVTEIDIPQYFTPLSNPISWTIGDNDSPGRRCPGPNPNSDLVFTNHYAAPTTGAITITKDITGESHPIDDVFTFVITGPAENEMQIEPVIITGEGSQTIENLLPGIYTVSESPVDNYSIPTASPVTVTAGTTTETIFENEYIPPNPCDPDVDMSKTVAVYDGSTIPADEAFAEELSLTTLNQSVIYKIEIEIEYPQYRQMAPAVDCYSEFYGLADIYAAANEATSNLVEEDSLLISSGGALVNASTMTGYPNLLSIEDGLTFYYIDNLEVNGTYTNTATLSENCYPRAESRIAYDSSCEEVASASAVVTVNYTAEDPDDDDPPYNPPSRNYNNVTYKANFPSGVATSGTVPTDSKNYSDGGTVTVKSNSGTLTAEGYTFLGWDTLADGSGADYLSADTFKIYNDVTLYAKWDPSAEPSTSSENTTTTPADPTTVVTAQSNDLDDVPKTGQSTPIMPLAMLGLLSAGATIYLMRRREA
jgi:LPXTG-motif cell wall-anchored protein/uncharacterized repeat protein (TIGR02543 family)